MITECKVSTVEGELFRLDVGGSVSMPIGRLQTACHWEIDFESKQVIKKPPQVGDRVLAYFDGEGFSRGAIIGLL
ncbi:hypothetical protein EDD70_2978 [Hydrogenoanaerobacterium saccharovorans]|uniref:Uncharacterized protein n=1 Tax=Hydrogenoanaerobacterium saccharovorans TaxID=474960 RepID=A0A1H7YIN0_9FIRM|nr:hypothetical protein [Hydrogenoanaerobacterium saccharovorans]RPF41918.1 hypothetical protein EDD70_2978 [Hydrogenoanaerobacterium saccharovorans]SEM45813.1 hypothetical protein SAMN05216180_0061 [Hydrogenoanaerobacterium saccharovorans]